MRGPRSSSRGSAAAEHHTRQGFARRRENCARLGDVAQLVERQLCKLDVVGSNPSISTTTRGPVRSACGLVPFAPRYPPPQAWSPTGSLLRRMVVNSASRSHVSLAAVDGCPRCASSSPSRSSADAGSLEERRIGEQALERAQRAARLSPPRERRRRGRRVTISGMPSCGATTHGVPDGHGLDREARKRIAARRRDDADRSKRRAPASLVSIDGTEIDDARHIAKRPRERPADRS